MPMKRRIWMVYDIGAILMAFAFTFYGLHYIISRLVNADASLFLLIPTFLCTAPAALWGYRVAYRRWYTDESPAELAQLHNSTNFWTLMPAAMALMAGAMLFYVLAVGYLKYRNDTRIGLCCSAVALVCYTASFPVWNRLLLGLLPHIERLRGRDKSVH